MLALVTAVAVQLSQTWVAPAARWLIDTHDWRFALRVLALAVLVCAGGAAAFLLRLNPAEQLGAPTADHGGDADTAPAPDAGASGTKAMRTRTYWTLTVADCLAASSLVGTQTHLVPWLAGRGVSADRTTLLASVLAFSGMVGVVLCAFFADRIPSQRFIAALYLIPLSGTALLFFSGKSYPLQFLGAVLTGAALSTVTMLLPYLVSRYFGLKASSEIYGFSLGFNVVSIGTVTLLISDGFDATGSYTMPMALVVGATALAFLLMATLKPFTYTTSRTPARSESAVLASPAEG
jgi:cyanate permease